MAGVTTHPQETLFQTTAFEMLVESPLHITAPWAASGSANAG